jgi:ankyrin repeat protein
MASTTNSRTTLKARTALLMAATANDIAGLARLLDAGADLDARDECGFSALMMAAYVGSIDAFEYLLARGADPNTADNAGNSVLMRAALAGNFEMVRQLLAAGADPRARNHANLDCREFAKLFNRREVLGVLDERRPQSRAALS